MEKVNNLFGDLKVKKIGTFNVETEGRPMDFFVTKILNSTTDHIGLVAMAPHQGGERDTVQLSQLDWQSLHVRTYLNRSELENAFKKMSEEKLGQLLSQRVKNPKWSDEPDIVLVATAAREDKKEYDATGNLPFKVVLHNAGDIERKIELIPALQTYNFTLMRK